MSANMHQKSRINPDTRRAFTLLEVMISVGLVAIVGLAIVAIVTGGTKGQKALQTADDSRVLTNDIASLLTDPTACNNTFGGRNPTGAGGFTVTNIIDSQPVNRYSTGNTYGNKTLKLVSITVGGTGTDARTGIIKNLATAGGQGNVLVVVDWRVAVAGTTNALSDLIRYFTITASLNGSSLISGCQAVFGGAVVVSSSGSGTVGRLPLWSNTTMMTSSNIYQTGASPNFHIGIGAAPSSSYALDVAGDMETGGVYGGCLRTSGLSLGTCVSDERLKTGVHPFLLGLESLGRIQPKYYRLNGLGGLPVSQEDQLGVIAQDLEKTAPELITTQSVKLHPEDKNETLIKAVNYGALEYIVINAVKKLYGLWRSDSDNLRQEMTSLESASAQIRGDQIQIRKQLENLDRENSVMRAVLWKK